MIGKVYESRLKNAKRNAYSGFIKQIVNIVLTFAIRTAVIYVLGAEYQGLSGLFSSILQVLNLSELGFSSAVTFILYKPIAEENNDEICAIIAYLKKIYFIIGIAILAIGILLMPFLPHLISGSCPDDINLYVLFEIYLVNSSISYLFFSYKSTLLTAMQREDIVSNIYTITTLFSKVLQFILLIMLENYYFYVLILPVNSLVNNLLLEIISKRAFPNIKPKGIVSAETKKEFQRQVSASLLNRICDIARNSLDNIVISSILGLVAVAIYGNYYCIFAAVYEIIGVIVHSVQASVGNSLVKETVEKNYQDCRKFSFILMWTVGWCAICMCCLYQPFMMLWMKGDTGLLLSPTNMILFCVYFYAISMTRTKGVYLEAKGLYWECRKLYILETLGNLVLNIGLCKIWGITGILIATIITVVVFNFCGGTRILFKFYFKSGEKSFYLSHIKYFIVTSLSGIITFGICNEIPFDGYLGLLLKALICLIVPNIIYFLIYFKTQMFKETFDTMKGLVRARG